MNHNTSPADLSKRIVLQQPVNVADGMGGFTVTWTDVAMVWAAIWPVGASEIMQSSKTTMAVTHRIRIRYRTAMEAYWRVYWSGRYFNIISIIEPDTDHLWLDVLCREAD